MPTHLTTGRKAPAFSAKTSKGKTLSLKDFAKKSSLVLYFYPRDNTTGCTHEAQLFRDAIREFKKLGVSVVGCSTDSVSTHSRFIANEDLPFPLLADDDGKISKTYGVLKPNGKTAERATFFIDRKGIIRKVWPKVTVTGHAQDVLDSIAALED